MIAFHRYFLSYLVKARTRQGLLFLALAGLFLSATALMVIQGIMGGLQRGLITRSQTYHGHGVMKFADYQEESTWWQEVESRGWVVSRERQTEILVRNGSLVAPLVLHGVDLKNQPPFLKNKDLTNLVLGADLASKLRTTFFGDVMLISPGTTDALAGEIPRQLAASISDYLLSDVLELDAMHGWVRIGMVQNLLRERGVERWRFFEKAHWDEAVQWAEGKEGITLTSWEEQNKTLVWALRLETRVMLLLFTAMALLVALAITTGLFLFFAKIRPDLASFWLLGLSMPKIERLVLSFVVQISALSCAIGVGLGCGILLVLERFGHNLMPDIFVERSFPIQINSTNLTISFFVPFVIALVFSLFSFFQFRRDNPSFIQLVRGAQDN